MEIRQILNDNSFRFNKQFGQNFITDTNLLDAIVRDSGANAEDTVLEIGTGAGTLTRAIACVVKRVVSFEIDTNLAPILNETLKGLDDKVEVYFKDIMRLSDKELAAITGKNYRIIANLPYYITTPIIMRFLECSDKPQSITIMVQKEVANRLVAQPRSADYGAITVAVDLVADARIDRIVRKELFYPMPKVDSAIVTLELSNKYPDIDINKVKKIVKGAFAMRRKTLSNNLIGLGYTRMQAETAITAIGLNARVRGEELSTEQFIELSQALSITHDVIGTDTHG